MLIHDGWTLRSGRKAEYEIIHNFHALDSDKDMVQSSFGLGKSILAAHQRLCDFLNGSQTEGQKVWGESVSLMPLGEEVEDRKYRAESQAASQKAWASCLSQPGTSGHVSTSCPQKTNQALCRAFVCLRAGGIWPCCINRLLTSPR